MSWTRFSVQFGTTSVGRRNTRARRMIVRGADRARAATGREFPDIWDTGGMGWGRDDTGNVGVTGLLVAQHL